ncbi:transcription initiation factor IIA large subunit KNAG_0J01350 [Huiozyma naganishii CBS 8797]|uniref:Transcription initiation factor IIA large subunit n=1 Tax=Huiozyma naganishii (strain ATCC MYA-139 / BCRC 22969 / CBS 8797 / KCTC 17520 / NBRC 10181 / NCYC 3082 / Yp74L-3) TaxID=1071383 RepID=J7SAJ1_HUIN7|nr:hypothetical protein KNAG_0J01350 [Kazachstania naganishii CBS 8797]CCK72216.1 hypothetical protein KNAG_0J01350 [Kazachstania naganishii CBS 8797]
MSNTEASRVYELIVEAVIQDVREDFENAGIDEQTLQDLKRNWQNKLTESKVTAFSWDDLNGHTNANTLAVPSLDGADGRLLNEFGTIKGEDTLGDGIDQGLVLPGFDSQTNNHINTGDPAGILGGDSIKQEDHGGVPMPGDTLNGDDSGTKDVEQGDESSSQQIELTMNDTDGKMAEQLRMEEKHAKRSALLDTDEVGSELDDSDDDYLISEGEEDGPDENLMLCLYDKVTRTKARWKCSLKDGVATINRRDYTFQKAQVEAEWV